MMPESNTDGPTDENAAQTPPQGEETPKPRLKLTPTKPKAPEEEAETRGHTRAPIRMTKKGDSTSGLAAETSPTEEPVSATEPTQDDSSLEPALAAGDLLSPESESTPSTISREPITDALASETPPAEPAFEAPDDTLPTPAPLAREESAAPAPVEDEPSQVEEPAAVDTVPEEETPLPTAEEADPTLEVADEAPVEEDSPEPIEETSPLHEESPIPIPEDPAASPVAEERSHEDDSPTAVAEPAPAEEEASPEPVAEESAEEPESPAPWPVSEQSEEVPSDQPSPFAVFEASDSDSADAAQPNPEGVETENGTPTAEPVLEVTGVAASKDPGKATAMVQAIIAASVLLTFLGAGIYFIASALSGGKDADETPESIAEVESPAPVAPEPVTTTPTSSEPPRAPEAVPGKRINPYARAADAVATHQQDIARVDRETSESPFVIARPIYDPDYQPERTSRPEPQPAPPPAPEPPAEVAAKPAPEPPAAVEPEKPEPDRAYMKEVMLYIRDLEIAGSFGEARQSRILVGGRVIHSGMILDFEREIRFLGVAPSTNEAVFQDRYGQRYRKKL